MDSVPFSEAKKLKVKVDAKYKLLKKAGLVAKDMRVANSLIPGDYVSWLDGVSFSGTRKYGSVAGIEGNVVYVKPFTKSYRAYHYEAVYNGIQDAEAVPGRHISKARAVCPITRSQHEEEMRGVDVISNLLADHFSGVIQEMFNDRDGITRSVFKAE